MQKNRQETSIEVERKEDVYMLTELEKEGLAKIITGIALAPIILLV
jgi:hypothetical protein